MNLLCFRLSVHPFSTKRALWTVDLFPYTPHLKKTDPETATSIHVNLNFLPLNHRRNQGEGGPGDFSAVSGRVGVEVTRGSAVINPRGASVTRGRRRKAFRNDTRRLEPLQLSVCERAAGLLKGPRRQRIGMALGQRPVSQS